MTWAPTPSLLARCAVGIGVLLWTTVGASVSAVAQTPASQAGSWEMPFTPWGHPDLQGNWSNATLTRFERQEGQEPVLTPAEVAEIEQGQADVVVAAILAPSNPDRPPPPVGMTQYASTRRRLVTTRSTGILGIGSPE